MSEGGASVAALRRVVPHVVRDGFLDPDTHRDLLGFTLASAAHFAPAMLVGNALDPSFRQAHMLARDRFGDWHARIAAYAQAVMPGLLADLGMAAFAPGRFEIELVRHNDGDFYRRHIDTLGHADAAYGHRILSMVYYFHCQPKGFDGGALRLFALSGLTTFADIDPFDNRLVAFPSWGPHEVRPIACASRDFTDSRFAINIWARRAVPPHDQSAASQS